MQKGCTKRKNSSQNITLTLYSVSHGRDMSDLMEKEFGKKSCLAKPGLVTVSAVPHSRKSKILKGPAERPKWLTEEVPESRRSVQDAYILQLHGPPELKVHDDNIKKNVNV
ncbi:hypothetical protein J6590_023860 [Homalodisca vitripennis]|nr:hypothetical protein J6590_023860 [Homalodisca vitripennis]